MNASIDDSSYQEYLNNADIGVDSSIEKSSADNRRSSNNKVIKSSSSKQPKKTTRPGSQKTTARGSIPTA